MTDAVVSVDRITKRFAGHTAVDSLSLSVPAGGVFGLLGPNGAGKSTTIRMIMHIIEPDEGQVTLFGGPGTGRELSARIGFLPEERGLYPRMEVLEHIIFLGEAKGLRRRDARVRALRWLDRLGLGDWGKRKVQELSKGMQQKVQFIGTLLHDPDLVILDEPFSGLDPVNLQVMKDVVVEIARSGRTVLFSTHIMDQAEKMCDRIAIIARGEKVVDGRVADIKAEGGTRHVFLSFAHDSAKASPILADRTLVARVDDSGATAEAELAVGANPDRLLRALMDAGVGLTRFEVAEPSLESIFIAKVGQQAATAPAQEKAHA
ncbi:MAG: ATP-binding cassette domain-containing protein [Gemmatimonadales bacterium]|jgi:ABC-2 type transport system ATP-binding protein|nr:MAG: ATP-binding cassette domain-containing protein [Gemmatimonadales bacterium]